MKRNRLWPICLALLASVSFAASDSSAASGQDGASGQEARNVVVFVADGLRPGSVNPTDAPTLYSVRQNGVNFFNSHALFPTFTTPNASAIATGHYLGDTGDFSNTIYSGFPVESAKGSVTPFIENDAMLADIDEKFPGNNFLDEQSLLAAARGAGFSTAAVGKLGPVLVQDVTQGNREGGSVPPPDTTIIDDSTGKEDGVPLSDSMTQVLEEAGLSTATPGRGGNGEAGDNATPGTTEANTDQQQYFADATTKAILPTFKQEGRPFAMVYWSRDPDGSQHNQGDSLNDLTPGINGPTSKAAVKNADDNLKQILDALRDQGLAENTDIFVTSDHGFSTISKSALDSQGTTTKSYAASLTYSKVNEGFLPKGFLAIDLARELRMPLYDPDTATNPPTEGDEEYAQVDPTQDQTPKKGNGLIGGTGKVIGGEKDSRVVVAANGGSDLIYLPDNDRDLAEKVVDFLTTQDYISGIFADEQALGKIPGTLPLSAIGLKGLAKSPVPSIVVNFTSFATDSADPNSSGVQIADSNLQQGQGMHGNFSRADTYNNMAAIGPDFKASYQVASPVSNADVAPTLAGLLGLELPSNGDLKGRILDEALSGGPEAESPSGPQVLQSEPAANGMRTTLNYQQAGATRYFDAAGFAGRTVGLPDTGGSPLFAYLTVVGAALLGAGALGIVLLLVRRDSQNFK